MHKGTPILIVKSTFRHNGIKIIKSQVQ